MGTRPQCYLASLDTSDFNVLFNDMQNEIKYFVTQEDLHDVKIFSFKKKTKQKNNTNGIL